MNMTMGSSHALLDVAKINRRVCGHLSWEHGSDGGENWKRLQEVVVVLHILRWIGKLWVEQSLELWDSRTLGLRGLSQRWGLMSRSCSQFNFGWKQRESRINEEPSGSRRLWKGAVSGQWWRSPVWRGWAVVWVWHQWGTVLELDPLQVISLERRPYPLCWRRAPAGWPPTV